MAHIRRHPKTGRWQVRYLDPWRKERSKTFVRKVDAEVFRSGVETAVSQGQYLDPARAAITISELASWWLASRVGVRPSTMARDRSYVDNYLVPVLGRIQVGELTFDHCQKWVADLDGTGLAPATVGKAHQLLGQILEQAVRARRIAWNPARGVELPAPTKREQRFLTVTEIEHLADCVDQRYRALVLLGAYGGLRWGEAAALHVEDVDFLGASMAVNRTLVEVKGKVTFGPPKTRASIRRVSLPTFLVEELAMHLATWPADRDGLVFTAPAGGPLRRTNFRRRIWEPAIEKAGTGPQTFHALRHSHVALLIGQGEHPKLIADRVGHSSPVVTMTIYAHLFPGQDAAAAGRLNDLRTRNATDPTRTQKVVRTDGRSAS